MRGCGPNYSEGRVAVMVDKEQGKAKRAVKPASAGVTAASRSGAPAATSMAALEAERDALKAELAAAKVRIEALEAANSQVINRLSWMIDSLQALKEGVQS